MLVGHFEDFTSSPFFARVSASLRFVAHHTDSALCHESVFGPERGKKR
jgi:hypothetical protein